MLLSELVTNKQNKNKHMINPSFLRQLKMLYLFYFVILHSENNAPLHVLVYTVYILLMQCLSQKQLIIIVKVIRIRIIILYLFQNSISSIKVHIMN